MVNVIILIIIIALESDAKDIQYMKQQKKKIIITK